MTEPISTIAQLNERSRAILRQIIETYLMTGEPVGSRNLSRALPMTLSPASIRNVMADLELAGLIAAPHTSAGRVPTQAGLRFFVDGLLEVGALAEDERRTIETRVAGSGRGVGELLGEATALLSGLSHCAGLVVTPTRERTLRHVEFVQAGPGRVLVVLVSEDGSVENRLIETPLGLPAGALVEATNFLGARLRGRTLDEVRILIRSELDARRAELDAVAARLVEAGLADWGGADNAFARSLIVRGQAHLLDDVQEAGDLERLSYCVEAELSPVSGLLGSSLGAVFGRLMSINVTRQDSSRPSACDDVLMAQSGVGLVISLLHASIANRLVHHALSAPVQDAPSGPIRQTDNRPVAPRRAVVRLD